jgi:tetratricopeptide (TPR) repeat protein
VASPWESSQALSQKGWILFRRDRIADARAAFDAAVKLQPENEGALVGQGELLYAEGRYTEALSRYDAALATPFATVDATLGKAKAQIALERLKEAKEALTAAHKEHPRDMRVSLWLGKAEEALGNKESAEKSYNEAVELADVGQADAISAYVALASLLATEGRGADAKAKLEQAKARLPDSAQLQRAFGQIAAAQGYYDEAVHYYELSLERDPDDLATRFRLGVTLRRMRKTDQAAAELDRVYTVDKEYPGLALERGLLFEETGEVNKALEMFQSALAKAPNDPDLQLRVGAAYVAINRPDDAIPTLKKIVEKRPNSAEAHHYLGRAYMLLGATQERDAMRELKRAVDLDPNRAEYHLYVAWAANEATPPIIDLVKQEVDKALTLDRLLPEAYWQKGSVERKTALVDDGIKDLKRALELRPNLYQAHAAMAECYEDKNDEPTAIAEWQKALKGDERPAYWRYKYGHLLYVRNKLAEAAPHLVYAAVTGEKESLRPGWLPQAEFMAGEALRKTGRRQDSIERYKRFVEFAPLSSPDRKDAFAALRELGQPVDDKAQPIR